MTLTRDDARLGDERTALAAMVEAQREALTHLLDDVSETEARARLVPSLTTVLGLVKHATFVEQVWFHHRVAGASRSALGLPADVDTSFRLAAEDSVATVREAYLAACERSREVLAQHPDLDERLEWHGSTVTLRFVLVHLVQELARHAGHGDILVEQLRAAREVP